MMLSHRNSRPIVVDDTEYRWAIAARSQGQTDRVTVIVAPPNNGQRLAVDIPCRDPYPPSPMTEFDVRSITPALVRQLIVDAALLGWLPTVKKHQFAVACVIASLLDDGGDKGATCHVSWQCPECAEWYSDDIDFGQTPPLMTTCGRTRHHANEAQTTVILFW
jgi:hypothetical protein